MQQPGTRPVPPPREAGRRPARVEPVPGTPYGLAIYGSPPAISGPAVGALLAGIAALLVALLVACLGLSDAATSEGGAEGWGALVGGAFAVLTGFLGTAGIGVGAAGLRQIRRYPPANGGMRGRGMAIAGIICGGIGIVLAACAFGIALLAAAG